MAKNEDGGLTDIGRGTDDNGVADKSEKGWKELIDVSIARSRKVRGGNFVQISTIDRTKMEPRCRTVVFRGFLNNVPAYAATALNGGGNVKDAVPCVIKMITDLRSNKVAEITEGGSSHEGNSAEMVWWFSKSNEQYRISGKLQFVGQNGLIRDDASATDSEKNSHTDYFLAERKQQWGNLSDSAREQFYWKQPGLSYTPQAKVPVGGRDEEGKILPVPDAFLLMLLFPTGVDYLKLGENYRQVDYFVEGSWESKRVNP